jgi:hypothetical protein
VSLSVENFRTQILRRAAEALGALRGAVDALLGEPEVGELHVSDLVEQDVLGLEVPVHDALLVQALEGERDLCRVEARLREGGGELDL